MAQKMPLQEFMESEELRQVVIEQLFPIGSDYPPTYLFQVEPVAPPMAPEASVWISGEPSTLQSLDGNPPVHKVLVMAPGDRVKRKRMLCIDEDEEPLAVEVVEVNGYFFLHWEGLGVRQEGFVPIPPPVGRGLFIIFDMEESSGRPVELRLC